MTDRYDLVLHEFMKGSEYSIEKLCAIHKASKTGAYKRITDTLQAELKSKIPITNFDNEALKSKEYRIELNKYLESIRRGQIEAKERIIKAADSWQENKGNIPSSLIAADYKCDHNLLTIEIQKRMAEETGLKIVNSAPEIQVQFTQDELDKLYPSQLTSHYLAYTPELFYFLKHNQ